MIKNILLWLMLALLMLAPLCLRAWGVDGHRAVGTIADRHLTRNARSSAWMRHSGS